MNNYDPYDPNQNQSYGDPQNTINGQGTESTYSQGGGQEQNTQPYHGQTQGDSTYHYSYQSPYQNVVNTTATPVTGSAPVPPSKKKEKKPRYLSRKAAAVFMALVILAAGGLGVGGGILGYQLAKGSGSGSGVNITTVQPSSGENTNAVNYTGDSMSVSDVAAMTSPSVVEITTEAVTTDIYMQQYVQTGAGSGVIISEDGYIVTNSHVIGDSNQYPVKVVFTGQDENEEDQEYPAQIVGYDKRTDIAVLKIDAAGLTPAEFADSDQLKVGDTVLSLGNPGVAGENFTNTLTKGMVSAVNRTVTMSSINMQYIQTDAAINPGSSGGALLNLYGQVVGINAAKITTTEIEGICFAIPTNIAKDVINDIVKNGYVSDRVRLGVTIRGLSSYEAEMYNVPQGLVIVGFSSDSEIPSKGAEIGDIITAINGVNTTSSNTLYNELEKFKAGEKVKLTIYRQASGSQRARTFEIEVTLLEDRGETQSAVTPTPEAP